ncbi:hypothetical protein KIPB_009203, partial [Kipferlia bialata]
LGALSRHMLVYEEGHDPDVLQVVEGRAKARGVMSPSPLLVQHRNPLSSAQGAGTEAEPPAMLSFLSIDAVSSAPVIQEPNQAEPAPRGREGRPRPTRPAPTVTVRLTESEPCEPPEGVYQSPQSSPGGMTLPVSWMSPSEDTSAGEVEVNPPCRERYMPLISPSSDVTTPEATDDPR